MKEFFLFRKFLLSIALLFYSAFLNVSPGLYAQTTELFLPFPETWTNEGSNESTEKNTKNPETTTSMVNSGPNTQSKSQNTLANQNSQSEPGSSKVVTQESQTAVTTNAKPQDKKKKRRK